MVPCCELPTPILLGFLCNHLTTEYTFFEASWKLARNNNKYLAKTHHVAPRSLQEALSFCGKQGHILWFINTVVAILFICFESFVGIVPACNCPLLRVLQ